jgi:hypothetical protein
MRSLFLIFLLLLVTSCSDVTNKVKEEKWKESIKTFSTEYGEMFGKEGKIGIIGSTTMGNENSQKWMWHFWGSDNISYKNWEVKAFKQNEKEKINPITFKDEILTPRDDRVKGHARSAVNFNSPGLWKIQVFIDGKLFDEMIINIHI